MPLLWWPAKELPEGCVRTTIEFACLAGGFKITFRINKMPHIVMLEIMSPLPPLCSKMIYLNSLFLSGTVNLSVFTEISTTFASCFSPFHENAALGYVKPGGLVPHPQPRRPPMEQ